MENKTVSAIVPVYNEEKTVAKVIQALLDSRLISEIICINDASADRSLEILQGFGDKIKLINFKRNRGKGAAVAAGIKLAKSEFLFFCDSDLLNFTPEHVKTMLTPVLNGQTQVVFGIPVIDNRGRKIENLRHQVYLAGERVYPRRKVLPYVSELSRTKGAGGSEVIFNTLCGKKEIKVVQLEGLIKPSKEQKWSSATAVKQYLMSAVGVLQEVGRIEINSASDFKKLENLIQVDTFENLTLRLREIKNQRIKVVFERYFNRYLNYVKRFKI
jgi:glycosyltransferase involved in cell wall biosynthesis